MSILEWSGLTVKKNKHEYPLLDVSGRLRGGKLTCLVGPSGAGKSILLQALAGRIDLPSTAVVSLVDSDDSSVINLPTAEARRSHIGLVSSEDDLLSSATPREALAFSLALRPQMINQSRSTVGLVDYYLALLDLDECRDTPYAQLPSLNAKRFSTIGTEMINERKILLLDAPLTGLSQLGAYQLIKNLKKLVSTHDSVLSGILCSLLQPTSEVLSLFDDIILMADRGLVIYQGPVGDMASYFARFGHMCPPHYNVSDFALFVLHSITPIERDRLAVAIKPSGSREQLEGSGPRNFNYKEAYLRRANFLTQLRVLAMREFRDVTRNWQSTLVTRFITSIAISLVIGLVYFRIGETVTENSTANSIHAYRGCVLVMCCNAMFANAQATVLALPVQRSIFQREYSLTMYSSIAYLSSKLPIEYFLSAVQVLVQLLISYFLCALNGNFAVYWIVLVTVAICAESIALSMSCLTTSTVSAIQTLPIALFPQIVFSGLIVSIKAMPDWISWIQYVCFVPYAMKLLCINEFGCASIALFTTNDIQCSNIGMNGAMLVFIALLFRIIALLALQFKPKNFK